MAGYRIRRGAGATKAQLKAQRRRARLAERLANAATPADRIAAATQHLRGVVKAAPPLLAEEIAGAAVEMLTRLADQVLDQEGGRLSDY